MEEILGLKEADLVRKTEELRRESFHLRVQQQSAQLEKPNRFKEIRRTIARMETARSQIRLGKTEKVKS